MLHLETGAPCSASEQKGTLGSAQTKGVWVLGLIKGLGITISFPNCIQYSVLMRDHHGTRGFNLRALQLDTQYLYGQGLDELASSNIRV